MSGLVATSYSFAIISLPNIKLSWSTQVAPSPPRHQLIVDDGIGNWRAGAADHSLASLRQVCPGKCANNPLPGLDPGIHAECIRRTWVAGSSPATGMLQR